MKPEPSAFEKWMKSRYPKLNKTLGKELMREAFTAGHAAGRSEGMTEASMICDRLHDKADETPMDCALAIESARDDRAKEW